MRISDWSSDVCSSDLDAPAVGGQRRCQRGVDAVARDRGAAGLEDGGEAVERAVRRPPVARDRRDPAVMLDDIKNVARREAGLFVDALEPRRTERDRKSTRLNSSH